MQVGLPWTLGPGMSPDHGEELLLFGFGQVAPPGVLSQPEVDVIPNDRRDPESRKKCVSVGPLSNEGPIEMVVIP